MERRAGFCLVGTMLALTLAALPALAQKKQKTTTVTTVTTTTTANTGTWDMTMPVSPESDEVTALQMISDRNITRHDIALIFPLLMDLKDSEDAYFDSTQGAVFVLASAHDVSKVDLNAPGGYYAAQQAFRDKRERCWAAIDKEIGADKATALRNLCEPQRIDLSITNYHTAWLDQIDKDLAEWDREAAARMAANGQTPPSTTVTTVSTTTTTVDTAIITDPMYTFPPLTTKELVDVCWARMTARRSDPEGWMMIRGPEDYNSPAARMLWEHHLRSWQ